MSKGKLYMEMIPRLYKRQAENIAMLFFVEGQRSIVPAISVQKALYNYFRYIREENFNIESAENIYVRLKKELLDLERS